MDKSPFGLSLIDHLSYIFPGFIMMMGLYVLAYNIPAWRTTVGEPNKLTWELGLLGIPLAYLFGMVSSSANSIFRKVFKNREADETVAKPLSTPMLKAFELALRDEYCKLFGYQGEWSRDQYYMVRSIVREYAPKSAEYANRQNVLRYMRKNCVLPVLTWGTAGVVAAVRVVTEGRPLTALVTASVSLVLSIGIATFLNTGAASNRAFEIRDNCLAFLHLARLGRLRESIKSDGSSESSEAASA